MAGEIAMSLVLPPTRQEFEAAAPDLSSSFESQALQINDQAIVDISKYMPVGCLRIHKTKCELSTEIWKSCGFWSAFDHPRDVHRHQANAHLATEIQKRLFESPLLQPFLALHNAAWFRMEFKTNDPIHAQARIYILPDDVGRRAVDRNQPRLRSSLIHLISRLDVSKSTWAGQWSSQDPKPPLDPSLARNSEDEATLFYLFNNLPSPDPDPKAVDDLYVRETMRRILASDVEGLDTPLYNYQQRSAALMLLRETQPAQNLDPRLIVLVDQEGKDYYADFYTGYCYRERRTYEAARGGILAETMGLGKTLICLSLILATKDFTSQIPPEYLADCLPIRKISGSLLDMAASAIGRYSVSWKRDLAQIESDEGYELANCREALARGAGSYVIPPAISRRLQRKRLHDTRRIWLISATLVVVPPNLIQQWLQEIRKHTHDLKVLVLTDMKTLLPSREELLTYDILLCNKQRFEKEAQENYRSPHHCRLRDFHFKRLIVDEGHTFGNSSGSNTLAGAVVESLQVSAKWIVSGTPTRGLYGVDSAIQISNPISQNSPSHSSDGSQNGTNSLSIPSSEASPEREMELFNKREREDLEKLGNIASNFLKARPWAKSSGDNDTASWNHLVMQPRHGSNSRGNMNCLKATLDGMIIRHGPEDVLQDVALPPLHQNVVYLDGSVQNKLSLNTFALTIITNAVTSERKDADYFFHPKQRKALMQLVSNLQQASFFWSGFEEGHIRSTIGNGTRFLEKGEVEVSDEDKALLRQAIAIGETVLSNKIFKRISFLHEMPLYIQNQWPADVQTAWSLDRKGGDPTLIAATLLIKAQKYIEDQLRKQKGLESFESVGADSMQQCIMAAEMAVQMEMNVVNLPASARRSGPGLAGGVTVGEASNSRTWTRATSSTNTNQRVKAELSQAFASQDGSARDDPGEGSSRKTDSQANVPEEQTAIGTTTSSGPASSSESPQKFTTKKKELKTLIDLQPSERAPLESTHIISTASAKLSYLMDKISEYQATEKILVFYEAENTAYYIAQALECLGIEHLIYAKSLSSARRSQYVVSFNQSPIFRVLLMDVSQAAFGLDISAASRVFFVNPAFSPQIEAQAVKRAHRIGQTRPVFVETLVLKGSIEEVILERRAKMTSEEHHRCKNILDDKTMYDWIKNVGFIDVDADVPGVEQMSELASKREMMGVEGCEDPDRGLVAEGDAKGKGKRRADDGLGEGEVGDTKKVRFA